jgi:hypothetical protein
MTVLEAGIVDIATAVDRTDELKAPRDGVRWLRLPRRLFVMIDGAGPVGEASISERMPGLYATAYTLHFALKRRGLDERVWPIELLMWTLQGVIDFDEAIAIDHLDWRWRLMIGLPDGAPNEELSAALDAGRSKQPHVLADELTIGPFEEGDAAQIMHVGPYSEERPTIRRLHAAITDAGLVPHGAHHEIYLGDPRRSAPENLRTIIRQPFRKE